MKSLFQSANHFKTNPRAGKAHFLYHLDEVDVNFGKIKALRSITLTINPNEIIFVTGKSGAGKSTLLNLLAGDLSPTKGRFSHMTSRMFVSQVFQDLKLFENQTCEENIWYSFDKKVYKSKNEFQEDMQELARVLGVTQYLSHEIKNVNGGMKQKIAILRALLARPNVLIADEPTCSLDNESASKIFEVLNYYNLKRNLTVIWASHNRELVKQFPGKILHLENGKLIYSGHACFI